MFEKFRIRISRIPRFNFQLYFKSHHVPLVLVGLIIIVLSVVYVVFQVETNKIKNAEFVSLKQELASASVSIADLQNQDQYKINQDLKKEIDNINKTYKKAVTQYEDIVDLDAQKSKTESFKKSFAKILNFLAERNYASADASLVVLGSELQKEKDRIAPIVLNSSGGVVSTASLPFSNTPPGAGYSRQAVSAAR